jgi:hypothetical protein
MPKRNSRSGGNASRRKSQPNGSRAKSNGQSASRSRTRKPEEFEDYSVVDPSEIPDGPDVLLDVPVVKVDLIDIEVDDLDARLAVRANVRKLLKLQIGAHAHLGQVELKIEGVEAQALVKARLENVSRILERVLTSLDRNPKLLEGVGKAVEEVGGGAGHLLGESGQAVEDVGEGAEQALPEVGKGASQALGDVGKGGGQAVGQVGKGANQALQQVGQGAQRGVAGVGKGAGKGVGKLGKG